MRAILIRRGGARTENHNILESGSGESTITALSLPAVTGPCDFPSGVGRKLGREKGRRGKRRDGGRERILLGGSDINLYARKHRIFLF